MGSRQTVWNKALHLHCDGRFLTFDFCLDIQLGRFLTKFANAAAERMVRHHSLLLTVGRLADLLRHVASLAFFAGLDRLTLIPVAQQIVGLAEVGSRGDRLVTIETEI